MNIDKDKAVEKHEIESFSVRDFKYFLVVKDLMVAGVIEQDRDNLKLVLLKGNAYKIRSTCIVSKSVVADQALSGIAFFIKSYEEAISWNIQNKIAPEVIEYLKKQKTKELT